MSVREGTPPRRRSRIVLGVVAAVVAVVVVVLVLALTGVTRGLFAKEIDRPVRTDVDASALVWLLVSYPDSFRGGTLADGRVDLHVDIDQAALTGEDLAGQPATLVMPNYSCPGADSGRADARLTVAAADPAHVHPRPAEAGGGVSLDGAFEISAIAPVSPGVPACRIDLVAR